MSEQSTPAGQPPLAERTGSAVYRDLVRGDTIEMFDEFLIGPDEWMKVGESQAISARWMIGALYYPNLYVPARRLISPNANGSPTATAKGPHEAKP